MKGRMSARWWLLGVEVLHVSRIEQHRKKQRAAKHDAAAGIMEPSVAASTLTRHRISVALLSLAATATAGYFCYRVYNPPLPEPPSDRRLHRSNAIRHRRRSLPDVARGHERQSSASEASDTSAESHGDENVDLNTVRPLTDGETVADDHVLDDAWYDDDNNPYSPQNQRAGQNIVNLLFRVSEDNARRNAYVHRGCQCNGCGFSPIRGIRYRCANCVDFDLCETCESQGIHTKTHIFYKIRVPAPRLGARHLQPVWYPGDPENCLRLLPKQLMARLSRETGFERPELEALWEQWTFMANTEWREDPDELGLAMDRKTFERYLVPSGGYRHITPNLLHDRMFAFYDDNNDDLIGFSEFLRGTAYRKRKDRLRRIFSGYDVDGDGYVNRRDFLRLFRTYYVLFKQMHKDLLDGLDDQVMSSTEVEQLITSRQPLSSLFGREGGFPQGDTDRPMQGKVVNNTTGEVHISDGGVRAVNEDTPDTTDRQSLLLSLFTKQTTPRFAESLFIPAMDNIRPAGDRPSGLEYLNGLLNPPTRISDLPALLLGETRDGDDFVVVLNTGGAQEGSSDEREAPDGDETLTAPGENGVPASGEDRAEHRLGTDGSSNEGEAVPNEQEVRRPSYMVTPGRRARQNARRKLFDRWKRRQFYLDEEEGALPPDDWSDDDDVLANVNGSAKDYKTPHHPMLFRSRSSSRVRFAEDTDDFDIRSNPSTSSRSIPERWGGMEIPDAERDVGKEVFYQIIQQAFNEILDTLFIAKEDLAVKAAETKEQRDKYRTFFESINLDEEKESQEGSEHNTSGPKPPQDRSLQELLATTGYAIDAAASQAESHTGEETAASFEETDDASETDEEDEIPPLENADDGTSPVEEPLPSADSQPLRDPTMPQFRPNASTLSTGSSFEMVPPANGDHQTTSTPVPPAPRQHPTSNRTKNAGTAGSKKSRSASPTPKPISRATLIEWKRLDLAEADAKARGGWGRLNYDEFERIYRAEEANGSRLDYLGTWIDFCIPYH
ncbi:hypothetical protein BT67DRAFT_454424 [Trichocladium antarcticum]|uniref:EF hand domain protein n=1 Tax=Trichocladium antarcticum TaxID=1450529 RepID=A0AAN6UPU4_9PEZI|nr:hypothetical protein BT67DRAFT_454424 [Trichocladium antarcticum]